MALSYADKNKAPVVVAKGYGVAAESIMRTARKTGVYVHESPELVALLMQVNLDLQIPSQLYVAVAEVMAWVASIEAGFPLTAYHGSAEFSNQSIKKHERASKSFAYHDPLT